MTEIEKIKEIIRKNYSSTARNKPLQEFKEKLEKIIKEDQKLIRLILWTNQLLSQTQQPIITEESIKDKKENELNSLFKNIHSKISLELLRHLNQEIRKNYPLESAVVELKPVLGTTDIKAIQNLTQSISNYTIYSNSSASQETIEVLVEIILPADLVKNKKIIHPRFTLHQVLYSSLLTPLSLGLIKLKSNANTKSWANQHLNQLLDLATPKLVFSSLLSLATTISPSQVLGKEQSQTQTEISQILSLQLLRPSGVRGLLQSIITEDYNDDDQENDKISICSATLSRYDSLYHILSHPSSSSVSPHIYWNTIIKNLIEIILPQFFDLRSTSDNTVRTTPDSIRRAACYILSQITTRQPKVYKSHLSTFLHSAFRPPPIPSRPSCSSLRSTEDDRDELAVPATLIERTLDLLNQLILNSEPSPVFVDRLIVPILPQLISLILYLLKTKAEPTIRRAAEELVQIWMKLHSEEVVANWLGRAVRELEAGRELNPPPTTATMITDPSRSNQWSRDHDGMPCITSLPISSTDTLEFKIDPDTLIIWFKSLKNHQFLGQLLSTWLDEVILLRSRTGFIEAKMTLFRIQSSLKILDSFEINQIISEPQHFFPFIIHTLRLHPSESSSIKPTKNKKKQIPKKQNDRPLTLDSLRLNLDLDEGGLEDQDSDDDGEEDLDLDHGIMVAGISLLLALIEGHPEMDEGNTPSLKEITILLDNLLLNQKAKGSGTVVSEEIYDLGIKSRLLLSVRKALSEVDHQQQEQDDDHQRGSMKTVKRVEEEEKLTLENQYIKGLKSLNDDCLPLRSQGIAELTTVLLTSTQSPHIQDSIKKWAPGAIELILRSIEDSDSFVYLSAIKALSSLAEKFYDIIGPSLADAFARPIHNDPSRSETDPGVLRDFERSVRVGEAMVQVVQRAGQALPLYIDRLLPSLLLVLSSPLPSAIPLKPSTLSILTICLESAPGALAPSLSSLLQGCLDILRSVGANKICIIHQSSLNRSPLKSDPVSNQENESSGTNWSDVEEQSQTEEEEEDNHNLIPPITSQIHSDHHHKTLIRSALLFIQTLLTQTLSLCHSSSSSYGDRMVLRNIRVSIGDHIYDIETVLRYLLISSRSSGHFHSPALSEETSCQPRQCEKKDEEEEKKNQDSPVDVRNSNSDHSSFFVESSLIQNALDSLTVLKTVLNSY
ncbi:hypothetical protein MJO28_017104 [Puccinia striiformis f. sp. tritici]|nr:hypothetical protein MJO28_017104 [Puccinia striiformis f. sp. tritici]